MRCPDAGTLAAVGLACGRGGRILFEGLDVSLAPGDLLLVRGHNGSGKSSLLRLMAGMATPAAGRLCWNGDDIAGDLPQHRGRLHLTGQSDGLKGLLTVAENLRYAASLLGGGDIGPAIARFDLAELADRPVRFLSSGQRRRTALARLIAVPRPLWLLDEPENGLDRRSRVRLDQAVADHRSGGGSVVLVTHGDIQATPSMRLDLAA